MKDTGFGDDVENTEVQASLFEPLAHDFASVMSNQGFHDLIPIWETALERSYGDTRGAITLAKSILETCCKRSLKILGQEFGANDDLPKLYGDVAQKLNIHPKSAVNSSLRQLYSTAYALANSLAAFRNIAGDAHGTRDFEDVPSRSHAQFAINISACLACFVVTESLAQYTRKHRITSDGNVILTFDRATVWRLIDHSNNAPKQQKFYGKTLQPSLLLVGDSGIYLMSNGTPRLSHEGIIEKTTSKGEFLSLVAYAAGCTPTDDFEAFWRMHNTIDNGSDFCTPISTTEFTFVLNRSLKNIVIVANTKSYQIIPDIDFERA